MTCIKNTLGGKNPSPQVQLNGQGVRILMLLNKGENLHILFSRNFRFSFNKGKHLSI